MPSITELPIHLFYTQQSKRLDLFTDQAQHISKFQRMPAANYPFTSFPFSLISFAPDTQQQPTQHNLNNNSYQNNYYRWQDMEHYPQHYPRNYQSNEPRNAPFESSVDHSSYRVPSIFLLNASSFVSSSLCLSATVKSPLLLSRTPLTISVVLRKPPVTASG